MNFKYQRIFPCHQCHLTLKLYKACKIVQGKPPWNPILSFDLYFRFKSASNRNHRQRFSPLQISDTSRAGFERAQNQSSAFVEWNCAVAITTIPRHHYTRAPQSNLSWKLSKVFTNPTIFSTFIFLVIILFFLY